MKHFTHLWQLANKVMSACLSSGSFDFLLCGIWFAVANVLGYAK